MQYSYNCWAALSQYLYDGNLLMDSNQNENVIRSWDHSFAEECPAAVLRIMVTFNFTKIDNIGWLGHLTNIISNKLISHQILRC